MGNGPIHVLWDKPVCYRASLDPVERLCALWGKSVSIVGNLGCTGNVRGL